MKTTVFRLFEFLRIVLCYYKNLPFFLTDLFLLFQYLWQTPHQVSKAFMKKRGEKNLYVYGETPLTTCDYIARVCGILSKDVVYELGCGSGRTVFWFHHFVKCPVVGIDYQPTFIRRANRVNSWLRLGKTTFLQEDFLQVDFQKATVIYLYGTCLEEDTILQLTARFNCLKKGTKVITVSYPLTDYTDHFKLEKHFSARFPWGRGDVFLNIKT